MNRRMYLCFECRKGFKQDRGHKKVCPECGKEMVCVGYALRVPKQTDIKEWKKIKILLNKGHNFNGWPEGPKPSKFNRLKQFFMERKEQNKKDNRQIKMRNNSK